MIVLKNFRIVDEHTDTKGAIVADEHNGVITETLLEPDDGLEYVSYDKDVERRCIAASMVIDGAGKVLMPAFVEPHAHFREPGFPEKETLESACMAAAAGGYATSVCMANTKSVTDTVEKVQAIRERADAIGLIDLYPVMAVTKNMEGRELAPIGELNGGSIRLLSEDGRDVADDRLFAEALEAAKKAGVPVSCHCDLGGENDAVRRVLELNRDIGCRVHIAHVSTKEAVQLIRGEKKSAYGSVITCEAAPHHIALTEADAERLGADTFGKVAPPLRSEEDRRAIIGAIADGTIDMIATDHAPHSAADKRSGSPGFTGFETAFAVCYTTLVQSGVITLSKLSSLMSASPARLLGLDDRGLIRAGCRADLCAVNIDAKTVIETSRFKSRGRNSPFAGRELFGTIVFTMRGGRFTHHV